jgi:hypothetical protein
MTERCRLHELVSSFTDRIANDNLLVTLFGRTNCFFKRAQLASGAWLSAMSQPIHHAQPYQRPQQVRSHNKVSFGQAFIIYRVLYP